MTISRLLRNAAVATTSIALVACAGFSSQSGSNDSAGSAKTQTVKFQQIRNATVKVEYAGTTFLVDPMPAKKGSYAGFEGTYNCHLRNSLVDLPVPVGEVLKADAIIVTHMHPDHWDEEAKQTVPKDMPVFAQNAEDAQTIRQDGFTNVRVLGSNTVFNGTRLVKTEDQHGSNQMMKTPLAKILGSVSRVVFQRDGYETLYLAGDTVWNMQVEDAIVKHKPDVIVLNTGYARVLGFDGSIIMGKEDLLRACNAAPRAKIIGSHMGAVNHAMQTRNELQNYIAEKQLDPKRMFIPLDGEIHNF